MQIVATVFTAIFALEVLVAAAGFDIENNEITIFATVENGNGKNQYVTVDGIEVDGIEIEADYDLLNEIGATHHAEICEAA
jgi:outer membrane receptor protein involved in Fe transport